MIADRGCAERGCACYDPRIDKDGVEMTEVNTKADDVQVGGTHYKDMSVQPWAVMEAVLSYDEFVGFLKGNVIKYSMRAGRKEGSDDGNKAQHYLQKLREVVKAGPWA